MNTTHRPKRVIAAALLSGALAEAALGLASQANATGLVGPLT